MGSVLVIGVPYYSLMRKSRFPTWSLLPWVGLVLQFFFFFFVPVVFDCGRVVIVLRALCLAGLPVFLVIWLGPTLVGFSWSFFFLLCLHWHF